MINTVFIDIDNTLLDFDKEVDAVLANMFALKNYKYDENVLSAFLCENNKLWQAHERGEITVEYLKKVRFGNVFETLLINEKSPNLWENDFSVGITNSCIKIEGAEEILRYLSSKYRVFVTSNGIAKTQYHRLKSTGFDKYLSGIFLSEEFKIQKPCKEFFVRCMSEVGSYNRGDYIIIGDSLCSDIKGGNNVGITTCYFNKNADIRQESEVKADYEVTRLLDIKKFL